MDLFEYIRWIELQANAHAVGMPKSEKVESTWQAILFRVGGQRMLVPLIQVRAILPPPKQVRVPGAKSWVKGLANLRGDLTGVYDLSQLFFEQPAQTSRHSVVFVAKTQRFGAAFLVDRSYGIRQIPYSAERGAATVRWVGVQREALINQEWLPILNLDVLTDSDQFMNAVA